MPVQINMDQIVIHNAPDSWGSGVDTFRRLLESAIEQEIQATALARSIDDHEVLRIDLPPITVNDRYDMQQIAREIARRILQAVRQRPE